MMFLILGTIMGLISSCSIRIYSKGEVKIPAGTYTKTHLIKHDPQYPEAFFDLDTGKAGNLEVADIWFGGENHFYRISVENGSISKYMGSTKPEYQACNKAIKEMSEDSIPNYQEEGYLCVQTNENNISRIQIQGHSWEDGRVYLHFTYVTWEK